ncbi:hypothetical protein DASC09_034630 [Saccharomycopsis crataegensis]|uniref:Uncharacterized protein n=1 Tax=Saccharomycopsis crataegensis TaxID=43959 RepID=A0AAV5QMP3_9ASCO|nr:hypothetical protein DASC09_034630 [Saccharomycopsis crataegensis]
MSIRHVPSELQQENLGDSSSFKKYDATTTKSETNNEQETKKRPPSTPLTPSLVTKNIMKKHRIDENELTKKNLRNILNNVNATEINEGPEISLPVSDDEDAGEPQEDEYIYPNASKRQQAQTHQNQKSPSVNRDGFEISSKNSSVNNGMFLKPTSTKLVGIIKRGNNDKITGLKNIDKPSSSKLNIAEDNERMKFECGIKNSPTSFSSFNDQIDFEIYRVNIEIEALLHSKKLTKKDQLIEFLSLERMFERQK